PRKRSAKSARAASRSRMVALYPADERSSWPSPHAGAAQGALWCPDRGRAGIPSLRYGRTSRMDAHVRTADADRRYLQELRHGAYLTSQLLQSVGYSGEGNDSTGRVGLFDKEPDLKEAYDRAFDAVYELYQ